MPEPPKRSTIPRRRSSGLGHADTLQGQEFTFVEVSKMLRLSFGFGPGSKGLTARNQILQGHYSGNKCSAAGLRTGRRSPRPTVRLRVQQPTIGAVLSGRLRFIGYGVQVRRALD